MVITYSIILLGLAALIRPLQKNNFYILHCALVIMSAYYIETHYFRASIFGEKTLLLFVVFQLISINIVTMLAYYADKRASIRKTWRVSEYNLHTLEFLGGWTGALLAQKMLKHKTKKKSYRAMFWFVVVAEFVAVYLILKFLRLI